MFRFGIVSKKQLLERRSDRPIAYSLIAEFSEPLSEDDDRALSAIYHDMMGGINVKRTFPGRYRTVDDALEEQIGKVHNPGHPVRVHEMAASNAVTSLELFRQLDRRFGGDVSLCATDYYDAISVVAVPGEQWRVVFDADARPLQFIGRHMVLAANRRERRRYLLNRLIQNRLQARTLPKAIGLLRAGKAQRVELFHPRCIAAARENKRFSYRREDAFNSDGSPCEVLRVMSFSASLLTDKTAAEFLRRACRRIVDGGLFVAGDHRDLSAVPSATIFQRRHNRLVALCDLSAGYERKRIASEVELAA